MSHSPHQLGLSLSLRILLSLLGYLLAVLRSYSNEGSMTDTYLSLETILSSVMNKEVSLIHYQKSQHFLMISNLGEQQS